MDKTSDMESSQNPNQDQSRGIMGSTTGGTMNNYQFQNQEESNKKQLIIGIIILVLIGVSAAAGWYFFNRDNQSQEPEKELFVDVTQEPEEEPTPVEVNKEDYSIQILNGSGVVGVAGDVQDLLEDDDFVVDDVGNADNYDYVETEIQMKEDVPDEVFDLLEEVLGDRFDVTKGDELDEDEDYDIIVIVGSDDAEAPEEDDTADEPTSDDETEEDEDAEPTAEPTEEPEPTEEA